MTPNQENHPRMLQHKGSIEVICGSMFSGKTEELIRRLKRAQYAKLNIETFKPSLDIRYNETAIVSHDANTINATPVNNAEAILLLLNNAEVVGIDEAQFFDEALPAVCEQLASKGIRVIVAGLDMDYLGKPFGQMPNLLAVADYITKLHAICMKCGNIAHVSFRKTANESQVLLGEKDTYEPRCRKCMHEK